MKIIWQTISVFAMHVYEHKMPKLDICLHWPIMKWKMIKCILNLHSEPGQIYKPGSELSAMSTPNKDLSVWFVK